MLRLLPLALLAATAAHAQVTRTVDNTLNAPSGALVYAEAQAAFDAAVDGDTVQFVPSPTSYGDVSVFRQLTVRGASFRARPEQGGHVVMLSSVLLTGSNDPQDPRNPSGSTLEGLVLGGIRSSGAGVVINDVLVENCIVGGSINVSINRLTVRRSVIGAMFTSPLLTFTNNVVLGGVYLDNATTTQVVDHNLFAGTGIRGRNILASNNIFLAPVPPPGNVVSQSVFTNNISFATSGTVLPPPGSTNSGTGNLENVNPRLVDFPTATTLATVLTANFRLQDGSPAIGAASDGTDIGPLGGGTPFTSFFSGSAPGPFVTTLDVSPAVFVGAPLSVSVEASGALADVLRGATEAPGTEAFGAPARSTETRLGLDQ